MKVLELKRHNNGSKKKKSLNELNINMEGTKE